MNHPQARFRQVLEACALAFLLLFSFYLLVIDAARGPLIDFNVYIGAARDLGRGLNIYGQGYEVVDRWGRQLSLLYLYPPFLAQVLFYLSALSYEHAKLVWCVIGYCCLLGSAWCLAKLLGHSWLARYSQLERVLAVYFLLVCFEPIYWGISDGQVTVILLFLLSVVALSFSSERAYLCGVVLGVAAMIKMSPALLLVAPLLERRWKVVVGFAAFVLASLLWTMLQCGAQALSQFFASFLLLTDAQSQRIFVFNYVFDKALLSPFGLADVQIARYVVRIILMMLLLFFLRGVSLAAQGKGLRYLAVLIGFMILLSPIVWFHHLAWAVVPLCVAAMTKVEDKGKQLQHLTRCLGIYFVLGQSNLIHYWVLRQMPDLLAVSALVPGTAILLLCLLLLRR